MTDSLTPDLPIFNPKQVAERLNLKQTQVLRYIRKGNLVAQKVGWNWIITYDNFAKFQTWLAGRSKAS